MQFYTYPKTNLQSYNPMIILPENAYSLYHGIETAPLIVINEAATSAPLLRRSLISLSPFVPCKWALFGGLLSPIIIYRNEVNYGKLITWLPHD